MSLVGGMMDIYCLLICGPKEAKTVQYTFLVAAKRLPKQHIAKFGFLWATNQPGFSPQGKYPSSHRIAMFQYLAGDAAFHRPPIVEWILGQK